MKFKMSLIILVLGIIQVVRAEVPDYNPHPVFVATYIVPTDRDLASYAIFKLRDVKFIRNNDSVSAKYTMPLNLFEESSQEVEMTGKIKSGVSFFTMKGDRVEAACSELGKDSYVCLLKFKKDAVKVQAKDDYFKRLYKDSSEAEKRILVARRFGADPIGILKIDLQ